MVSKGAQEDHLAIRALGVRLIPECIEDLLKGHCVLLPPFDGLPNDAIGTLSQALKVFNAYGGSILIYIYIYSAQSVYSFSSAPKYKQKGT